MNEDEDSRTPEQIDRDEAEADGQLTYSDGRPKMHRHFASFEVHSDADCQNPNTPRRVYVFDAEDLDRHERFIAERARAEERKMWARLGRVMNRS